jgi:hypothetical protein
MTKGRKANGQMSDKFSPDEAVFYRVRHNDDDMIRNLHRLYDSVRDEPVPEYLMDLLKKLPQ